MSARTSVTLTDERLPSASGVWRSVAWLRRLSLAGLLAGPLLSPVCAGGAEIPPTYRVAPGDRVSITVFGQADLSGDSMVDGAYSVTVPLIGPVSVRGLSVPEIEQRIAQRLSDGYVQKPVVSVRLTEPRPIYVVGDVKSSGSYPYRHGLSVMGAVALSGGFVVSEEQAQTVLRTDVLQADERVRTLEMTRSALVARRIRLEAQRDERPSLDFGEVAGAAQPGDQLAEILKSEAQMHAFQMAALKQQVDMLKQQEPKLLAGKQFLRDQLSAEKRQLELIQQHLVDYNALLTSGLARRYTGIELQREEARNRGNIARLSGDMSTVELSVGELNIRIQEARDAFQRRVRSELQETLLRIAETEMALPTARTMRELRLRQAGLVDDGGGPPRRSLFVTRMGEQGSVTFAVTDSALLEPGDIVRVERMRAAGRSAEPVSMTWR